MMPVNAGVIDSVGAIMIEFDSVYLKAVDHSRKLLIIQYILNSFTVLFADFISLSF